MRIALCVVSLAAGVALCMAGVPPDSAKALPVTGNIALDLFGLQDLSAGPHLAAQQVGGQPGEPGRKSPWLAAGLSLVVPGAGEFYTESYWKSALFLAIEAGAWVMAYSYDKRADRQTDYFQDYADTHWSVVQYAQFAQANLAPKGTYQLWKFGSAPPRGVADPWDYVNWDELNRMERDIAGYYSHTLPPHGDQQYFEEIGKYPQYNQGWDDANLALNPDYYTVKANITPRSTYYMTERALANTYYEHATTFVSVAILNHLVSAVDAALSAGWFNNRLHAQLGVQTVPDKGGIYTQVPVVKLAYRL